MIIEITTEFPRDARLPDRLQAGLPASPSDWSGAGLLPKNEGGQAVRIRGFGENQ